MIKVRRKAIAVTVAILLLAAGVVSAHEVIQGEMCHIEAEQTITSDVFVVCRDLVIDGQIDGNLIGVAGTAVIHGTVSKDVYLLAAQLDVSGTIGDDLHFGGGILQVEAPTVLESGDIFSLDLSATIADGVDVPGSIISVGYQLTMSGTVARDISFWGSALTIDGRIHGDVDAQVAGQTSDPGWLINTLFSLADVATIDPGLQTTGGSRIDGQLRYTAPSTAILEGKTIQEPVYTRSGNTNGATPLTVNNTVIGEFVTKVVREFVTLGLIGILILALTPRLIQSPIATLRRHPFNSLGIGIPAFFLPLVVLFIAVILTLVTMIVLSLVSLTDLALVGGMISGLLSFGGVSVFYFVAIFVTRILVGLALGQVLIRATIGDDGSQRMQYVCLLTGVLILALLGSLPGVGWLINAGALAFGLGAILTHTIARIREIREAGSVPPRKRQVLPAYPILSADHLPLPLLDDGKPAPGMDNLPPDFDWWDD